MNEKEVIADFQFLGSRVVKLLIETKPLKEKSRAELTVDFDYETNKLVQENNIFIGGIRLIILIKAKIKNKVLFKIDLVMEGAFSGDSEKMTKEKFTEMVERNGLITLMHLSRAFLIGVSAQSGINPPIRIPMINITKLRESKQKSLTEGNNDGL